MRPRQLLSMCASVLLPVLIGCGSSGNRPDLGQVEGTVTFNGTPVENAQVVFKPANGRESHGVTDAEGRYELNYIRDNKGAATGEHQVIITPPKGIPARQATSGSLQRVVESGSNRFDFELGTNARD